MEGDGRAGFEANERTAAENFVAAAQRAGVRRVVYLGGLVPQDRPLSRHLRSRLEVERILLAGLPEAVALRASIVIGARSRSFRFMVHLVERMSVLTLPAWREHRTQPIDARDVGAFLLAAATTPHARRRVVTGYRGARRTDLRTDDRAHRRPHARAPARAAHRPQRDADRGPDRRRDRRRGRRASSRRSWRAWRAICCRATIAPRDCSACAFTASTRAVERALREWEAGEPLAAR